MRRGGFQRLVRHRGPGNAARRALFLTLADWQFYNFGTNLTRQQVKICFTKIGKTATRFFSMRVLGIFSLLIYLYNA
jgi:hypothetical protein